MEATLPNREHSVRSAGSPSPDGSPEKCKQGAATVIDPPGRGKIGKEIEVSLSLIILRSLPVGDDALVAWAPAPESLAESAAPAAVSALPVRGAPNAAVSVLSRVG